MYVPYDLSKVKVLDLSQNFSMDSPPFAFYEGPTIKWVKKIAFEGVNAQHISSTNHIATHLDSPYHFYDPGPDIAGIPIDTLFGPACIVDLSQFGIGDYDFMLIDCPPSLSLLTVNAFAAAEQVLIPMQCEYYALEGLSDLVGTIKRVRSNLNPRLEIAGLLRTMFDPRNTLANQVSQQLEQHFGDKVYRTMVPRNVRLAEAPSYGAPAVTWDKTSKGAQAYVALTEEILKGNP